MKRNAIRALILILACAAPAQAQVSFGLKAGVNFANVAIDPEPAEGPSPSGRAGALAGVFAIVPIAWGLTIQPEALYTVKGASFQFDEFETNYVVDYLEFPVLARFGLFRRAYVVAGPSVALRLRARSRTPFGGSTEEIDLEDDVERFDLGIVTGAGMAVGPWLVDARYTYGLSDTDKDRTAEVKISNRALSLSAGYRF